MTRLASRAAIVTLLAGCIDTPEIPPPDARHPASLDAAEAPVPPRSTTLSSSAEPPAPPDRRATAHGDTHGGGGP